MPELPEVEVVRLGLLPAVTGATISSVEVLDVRSVARHEQGVQDFEARLTGAMLEAPERRGKFLWIPIRETNTALGIHLGMSGQVLLRESGAAPRSHTRIRFEIDRGSDPELVNPALRTLAVHFDDQRIFGSVTVAPLVDGVPEHVLHIARDPLDPLFDDEAFVERLRRGTRGIKSAILDQGLISGIGNIYADEALWAARLHYLTPVNRVSKKKAFELLDQVRLVLEKALAEGGTSFDAQYVNVNGNSGYFSHSLNAYGQQGKPCPRCATLIVREQWANRSSHRCPKCQKKR
ncbi:bifunctional DNA-formamidopyrimidine glycosylase/DNA-(apurinic or apyrimidinic site) lyase [Humidisolicoccus flavus]|uniref:bifunctional DNA-formamidopyrimidine glycosylase/DNA-(apurinic or apyrimidinic site) lyase n=1 Tax=Humidisolicoccus flavus TaxID=3111414 RepID=UPI00324F976D